MTQKNNIEHLYLHVPFCKSICYYCDFCHVIYQENIVNEWLDAIQKEIQDKNINPNLKTIYIGGGTPTSLNAQQLDTLLSLLDAYTNHVEEYTIEINPETLTLEKIEILRKHGINRISIGLQSHDAELLKSIGRNHTKEDVSKCVEILKENGINNISLDVMYSLPNQTIQQLKETLEFVISLDVKHVSLYSLTIEENTVFHKRNYQHLSDEVEADMYDLNVEMLEKNGFMQYEVANFSKEGYESKHNLAYWLYKDFYGIGAGASGKEDNYRYDHTKNVKEYIHNNPIEYIELSNKDQMFETIMMGIRLKKGISCNSFEEKFGISMEEAFPKSIKKHLANGNVIMDTSLRLSKDAYPIMNEILVDFLEEIEE